MTLRTASMAAVVLYSLGQAAVGAADEPKTAAAPDTLLYIKTIPPGARVFLDGKELGTSDGLFHVSPGKGTIRLELEGFAASEKEVNIQVDEITRIKISLKPADKKAAESPATGEVKGDQDAVVEGVGWHDFKVGATLEELTKAYGPPDENVDSPNKRTAWNAHHIECFIPRGGAGANEVRFLEGFGHGLKSGVRIGSTEKEVLNAYGAPDAVRNQGDHRKMLEYVKQGVLMWLANGKVESFTVMPPRESNAIDAFDGQSGANAAQLAQEGWQLWSKGQSVEATEKFRAAVALAPKDQNAWNGLGWALFGSGKWQEAKEVFEKVLTLNPNHPAALNGLGQIYFGQKKFDLAEKYLLEAAPKAPAAWYGLAKLYLLQGKFEEAQKYAQRLVDSGQADKTAERMLEAAKQKRLEEGLRVVIEPPMQPEPEPDAEK